MNDNEIITALKRMSEADKEGFASDVLDLINRQRAEIERLKEIAESPILGKLVYMWKNEAIREFAELLKKNTVPAKIEDYSYKVITEGGIDYCVKEMVGESDEH